MAATTSLMRDANGERIDQADCDHGNAEPLGSGGSATYLGCSCGVVLVVEGGRVWAIASTGA